MRLFTDKIFKVVLIFLMTGTLFSQTVGDAIRLSQPGLYTNARAMAMGNAYSVIGNDYSAVLFNPATLGLTESTEFTGSINYDFYANNSNFFNTQTKYVNNTTTFSQFGIVVQLKADTLNSFALAIGYTHTKDFNRAREFSGFNSNNSLIENYTSNNVEISRQLGLSYPINDRTTNNYLHDETIINGNLQQNGFDLESGGLNVWSFGLSYEFANNIFLGASANYSVGSYLGDSEFYETDINNNYSIQADPTDANTVGFSQLSKRETREWAINGYDFRIGILYKLWNFIGVGISFKTPTNYNIIENYSYSAESQFAMGYTRNYDKEELEKNYKISTPYELTVGAMVNLWIITAAVEGTYTDYSQIAYEGGLDYKDQAIVNKYLNTNFDPLLRLNGGAEFRLPFTGLSARAGAMLIMTPSHSDQKTEDGKIDFSYDKKYLNAGIGFRSGDNLEFDITYTYGWWTVINENYGEGLSTVTNDIQIHNVIFTTSFRL
ncbi:MAG: hypothetical protein L3J41_08565 [Melioribacteraceae bacterium]|nr:hypothetical protein [Melioribacteraceae bacterium]